ncbi:hypothetical protein [Nitrosomonas ureae]|uniref:Uncharacterized protein n=1 Tax=Nitrosomonas ureae TaxID=44577 RepID=A0A1H5YCP9_9PROT|nr:hypothetical protein [Nitrosomonas ureae]SEG21206.1 hypothetical protein SAMN05216334_1457 [Nitrosomonas ureae]
MKLQDRLRKLEAFAKVESQEIKILKIIVEPDGAISDALQRNTDGERFFYFD